MQSNFPRLETRKSTGQRLYLHMESQGAVIRMCFAVQQFQKIYGNVGTLMIKQGMHLQT